MAVNRARDPLLVALALLVLTAGAVVIWSGGMLDASAAGGDRTSSGADGARGVATTDEGFADAADVHVLVLDRFSQAVAAAESDGVEMWVTSGLRTAEVQEDLVDEAVARHGEVEARRWALPPERSAHVRGTALDVGGDGAEEWLAEHGAYFGFCHVYENEPWHVELLVDPGGTCPPLKPDASVDWPGGTSLG